MATYTAPTTRSSGDLVTAAIWNTDLVENLKYFKDTPSITGLTVTGDVTLATLNVTGKAYVNDSANANMTIGLTLNQGANDDELIALKSSDIAHGITSIAETDTYGTLRKVSPTAGGVRLTGFSTSNNAVQLRAYNTSEDTTKGTGSNGFIFLDSILKSGTSGTGPSANSNLVVVGANSTIRFILDADGDSHQDVGTAWTNFDDRDDALTLTALSAAVSHPGDPVREAFVHLLESQRGSLEAAGLVTFNADGHHFINWSRTNMLVIGAVRQLAQRLDALTAHLGLPDGYGVRLLPGGTL